VVTSFRDPITSRFRVLCSAVAFACRGDAAHESLFDESEFACGFSFGRGYQADSPDSDWVLLLLAGALPMTRLGFVESEFVCEILLKVT
jgi:hypothetical protein